MTLLHGKSALISRSDLEVAWRDIPPASTSSWHPVPYDDFADVLQENVERVLDLTLVSEEYSVTKNADQFFGVQRYRADRDDSLLAFGLRGSKNKSLANGLVAGSSIMVCDNLCFSGDAFRVQRKNTTHVWDDLIALIKESITGALTTYQSIHAEADTWAGVPVELDRGYELLGRMLGRGKLTSTAASVAFSDWTTPRHEAFADRNLWSLYNCVTEGVKKGTPARRVERQTSAHQFFQAVSRAKEVSA